MTQEDFVRLLPAIERVIAFVVRRHRLAGADAEDFASQVKVRLIEDDYAVIRKFQGRSSIETFLAAVIAHLFQDFRNSEWGKWRPSAAARKGGPVAVLLERYIVRDRLTFDEACESLRRNHGVTEGTAELERLAAALPVRFRRRFEPEQALVDVAALDSADQTVLDHERLMRTEQVLAALKGSRARLNPEDALIVALRFDDGKKVSDIATMLGVPAKPLYARIDALKLELRRSLEAEGIAASTVREVLDDA